MATTESIQATGVKKDSRFLQHKATAGEPIVMLTCYDYPMALLEEQAGVDAILVGDSVGTNVLGYASEQEVTLADISHHLRAVRRGVQNAYLLADLPYQTFATPEIALKNASVLLANGADGVKLEGGAGEVAIVRALAEAGIDVCGHIGFTPQTLGSKGKVQGKSFEQGQALIQSALALEAAGAFMIVLELVTEDLSRLISEQLRIPTIGIGSGRYCDGQVLVVTDVLGTSPMTLKIAKRFGDVGDHSLHAIEAYTQDVLARRFPMETNAFPTKPTELALVEEWLRDFHLLSR